MEKSNKGRTLRYALTFVAALLALSIAFPAGALAAEEGDGFWSDPIGSLTSLFSADNEKAANDQIRDMGSIADPSTSGNWENFIFSSTENTGRIWTDKSVTTEDTATFDGAVVTKTPGSDFMVSLSAMSSVLDSTATVLTQADPLDIVLVLDASGSMDYDMGGGNAETVETYVPVYDLDTSKTYYVEGGFFGYREVTYSRGEWSYETWNSTVVVEPMKASNDASPNHVQFYEYTEVQAKTRMDALCASVDNFLTQLNAQNAKMTGDKHQVALVKFASNSVNSIGNTTGSNNYNNSQIVSDFTTDTDVISQKMHAITPAGATRADYGFNHAKRLLDGSGNLTGPRENTKKVVIFFTDGTPTESNSFHSGVANDAVSTSQALKASGVTVYSVGIFDGANADPAQVNSSNENSFMNAVSSNYPEATKYNKLGNRADEAAFYKTAITAEE